MVTKEQVAEAYLRQEYLKKTCGPNGGRIPSEILSGPGGYYATSPIEPFAVAALELLHIMFGWECENPAPKGKYWTCMVETGMPALGEYGVREAA